MHEELLWITTELLLCYFIMVKIRVRVVPRAKKNRILGWQGDALRVHIAAPPIKGKANEALVKFLADEWGVSRASVKIIKGETAREKALAVPDGVVPLPLTLKF